MTAESRSAVTHAVALSTLARALPVSADSLPQILPGVRMTLRAVRLRAVTRPHCRRAASKRRLSSARRTGSAAAVRLPTDDGVLMPVLAMCRWQPPRHLRYWFRNDRLDRQRKRGARECEGMSLVAPPSVLRDSHRFQVCRIDAARLLANVVDLEVDRDGTNEKLVRVAVRDDLAPLAVTNHGEVAVARRLGAAGPKPAPVRCGGVDLEPEPLFFGQPRRSSHHHSLLGATQ